MRTTYRNPIVALNWNEMLSDREFEGVLVNRFIAANDALNMFSKFRPTAVRVLERVEERLPPN